MKIVFYGDGREVVWRLPMFKKEDEHAIMDMVEKNRVGAEGVNGVAQLLRLVDSVLSKKK